MFEIDYEAELIKVYQVNGREYVKIKDPESLKVVYDMYVNDIIPNVDSTSDDMLLFYVGQYYRGKKDTDKMMQYLSLAVDKCNSYAMNVLGLHFELLNDIENMMKYYM